MKEYIKKTEELIKILNRKHIIIFCFLIFFSCNRDKKQFLYSNVDKSNFYEIIYFRNKIILINNSSANNIIYKDTSIFTKKKGRYFSSYKGTTNDKESLIMCIDKDTIYEYKNMGKVFLYKIGKNGNETFKAVSVNIDSLKFKLKTSIYYDNKYNIFMIEEFLNGKTTRWR